MSNDPVMRYIDVLKDRVKMLEKECAAANALIEEMEMLNKEHVLKPLQM
jgi:hypothetical protein